MNKPVELHAPSVSDKNRGGMKPVGLLHVLPEQAVLEQDQGQEENNE